MKIAISSITENGNETARLINCHLLDAKSFYHRKKGGLKEWINNNFNSYDAHIFIMSLGIVYRLIEGLIDNKYNDPAIVVVDDAKRFSIAALSGHEGGANDLANKVAQYINAIPVITTASDSNKNIIIGIGCRKGVKRVEVKEAIIHILKINNIALNEIRLACSIEIKKSEKGLLRALSELEIPLIFIPTERIKTFTGFNSVSEVAMKHFDIPGVSEPAALIAGKNARLIQKRVAIGPVTIALAKEELK